MGLQHCLPLVEDLAVTNHALGIDWYSFTHDRFMCTSHYSTHGRNADSLITQVAFIDEDTVVVGHCAGSLAFVTFGMTHNPFILAIGTARKSLIKYIRMKLIKLWMNTYCSNPDSCKFIRPKLTQVLLADFLQGIRKTGK